MAFRTSAEIRDPFDVFVGRLRALGATEQEVGWVVDAWNDDLNDQSPAAAQARKMLTIKSDAALRDLLQALRTGQAAEAAFASGAADANDAPADPAAAADARRAAVAAAQASWDFDGGADFNLDQLSTWVGDNPARAQVAELAERSRPDPRKGAADIFERFADTDAPGG